MNVLRRLPHVGLPLLLKELQEQSARPRTFILRVAYASLLILMVAMANSNRLFELDRGGVALGSNLGVGAPIFQTIVDLQFMGINLFLPAIVCGVLTVEKERNTLGLLLITKLGGWTIIFEKLASRIVPMLTFLFISLPLISFTYSLGGMEVHTLFFSVWFLLLAVVHVSSLAVLASSFFSGTVGAFFGTYLLIGLFYFGPPILDFLLPNHAFQIYMSGMSNRLANWIFGLPMSDYYLFSVAAVSTFSPYDLFRLYGQFNNFGFIAPGFAVLHHQYHQYTISFLLSVPILTSSAIAIALARFFLIRRAFISSTNPILSLFKWLDWIFLAANKRFAAGVVLVKESQTMPGMEPVAWRETAKRSMGQFRYLVRIFVTLQFPTMFLLFLVATGPAGDQARSEPVSAMIFLVWIICAVLISVTASNLIASERSRQTFDVLLSTPINGRDLIRQKLRGVQRLMLVLAIPLLTCIGFQTWWRPQVAPPGPAYARDTFENHFNQLEYLVTTIAGVVILFHLTMWMAFWIGLRMKSPTKAMLSTLGILVAVCALPTMLTFAVLAWINGGPQMFARVQGSSVKLWLLDSPSYLVFYSEIYPLSSMTPIPYLPVILNSAIYGGCWWLIRHQVLSNADKSLNRISSDSDSRRIVIVSQELTSLIKIRS
jgi:ABC-type transport system involved in multi-copper enzyme maturation permease subunit